MWCFRGLLKISGQYLWRGAVGVKRLESRMTTAFEVPSFFYMLFLSKAATWSKTNWAVPTWQRFYGYSWFCKQFWEAWGNPGSIWGPMGQKRASFFANIESSRSLVYSAIPSLHLAGAFIKILDLIVNKSGVASLDGLLHAQKWFAYSGSSATFVLYNIHFIAMIPIWKCAPMKNESWWEK